MSVAARRDFDLQISSLSVDTSLMKSCLENGHSTDECLWPAHWTWPSDHKMKLIFSGK
jgi:hypothetical protein